MSNFRLCFAHGEAPAVLLYFADVDPAEMRGNEWGDVPALCNAGAPYGQEGSRFREFVLVHGGSVTRANRSAESINRDRLPWIEPSWGSDTVALCAGATIEQARAYARAVGARLVEVADGEGEAGR